MTPEDEKRLAETDTWRKSCEGDPQNLHMTHGQYDFMRRLIDERDAQLADIVRESTGRMAEIARLHALLTPGKDEVERAAKLLDSLHIRTFPNEAVTRETLRGIATALRAAKVRGFEEAREECALAHEQTAAECRDTARALRGIDAEAAKENLWRAEFHETIARCIRALQPGGGE